MATIEHPIKTLPPPEPSSERPVFVATSDRRARILRRVGVAAAILAALWVAALGIGMLGFGRLPGVPLPPLGKLDRPKASPKVEPANAPIVRDGKVVPARLATSPVKAPARSGRGRSAGTGSARSGAKARTVAAAPAPLPRPKQTGWAHRGSAVPPGQARRPQTPPGQQRVQGVNPGQVKKAATTPPPPPPPVAHGQQKPPKKA